MIIFAVICVCDSQLWPEWPISTVSDTQGEGVCTSECPVGGGLCLFPESTNPLAVLQNAQYLLKCDWVRVKASGHLS